MKPEEIRITIAEAVGWHPHPDNIKRPLEDKFWTFGGTTYGVFKCLRASYYGEYDDPEINWSSNINPLPKYDCDLNAIHEAEKILTEAQWNKYVTVLARTIIGQFNNNVKISVPTNVLIAATAGQRAEALLRTLNLWKTEAL